MESGIALQWIEPINPFCKGTRNKKGGDSDCNTGCSGRSPNEAGAKTFESGLNKMVMTKAL